MSKDKTVMMELIDTLESMASMVDNNSDHEDIAYADGMNYAKELATKLLEKEKIQTVAFGIMAGIYACKNRDQTIVDGREYLENVYDKIYKQD